MEEKQNPHSIPFSTPQKMGVMHVSKWQSFHLNLSDDDIKNFFETLGLECGYRIGQVVPEEHIVYPVSEYRQAYTFFRDNEGEYQQSRKSLMMALSVDPSAFFAQALPTGVMVRAQKPYIQLRMSTYSISSEQKVLPGALGVGAIPWGIQCSYPLLFMNDQEGVAKNVLLEEGFINTPLYKAMQRWVREHTKPATLVHEGTAIKTTLRSMR